MHKKLLLTTVIFLHSILCFANHKVQPSHPAYQHIIEKIHAHLPNIRIFIPTNSDTAQFIGKRQLTLQALHIEPHNQRYTIEFSIKNDCNGSTVCSNGRLTVGTLHTHESNSSTPSKPVEIPLAHKIIPARISRRGTFGQLYNLSWNYNRQSFNLQSKSNSIIKIAHRMLAQGPISLTS
jgi:hypothetical protein